MRVSSHGPGRPIPAQSGIGLRSPHHELLVRERPQVGWIEAHIENYFHDGGPQVRTLKQARAASGARPDSPSTPRGAS